MKRLARGGAARAARRAGRGQSDVYPGYLKVTARILDAVVTGDQIEHPLAVASGHFDAAFVVLFLYPLLIFAVSFDLTATERDRGTLRMVLAQPVRLGDVVAGKMIARALMLALPVVLIPVVVTVCADWRRLRPAAALDDDRACIRSIWHGIALWINSRGWNAAANALVLAGIWLIFAIVGPASINLLIAIRYPMPSRVEAAVQARAATQEATVQGSRQLGQFLQDHPTSPTSAGTACASSRCSRRRATNRSPIVYRRSRRRSTRSCSGNSGSRRGSACCRRRWWRRGCCWRRRARARRGSITSAPKRACFSSDGRPISSRGCSMPRRSPPLNSQPRRCFATLMRRRPPW